MKFIASLDKLAKTITISLTALFTLIMAFPYFLDSTYVTESETLGITLFLLFMYLGLFIFRPISYSITDQEVVIHRPFKNIKISRKDIESVELLDKNFSENTFRTNGVGGAWGYFGTFSHSSIGDMTWYVTRRDKLVLLRILGNKKIVLSPDEVEGFAGELSESPQKSRPQTF